MLVGLFSQRAYVENRLRTKKPIIDEMKRFRLLTCTLFCGLCVSLVYAFDLFTSDFSNKFGLTAAQMSTISTVGTVVCYFALPYGVIYNYSGPTTLLILAMLTGTVGCIGLLLAFHYKIPGNTVTFSIFYALLNACSGMIDGATIVPLAETFPRNRGPVVALAKVLTGLGASVLASISSNVLNNNINSFIYFLMALLIVVSIFSIVIVELPPYVQNSWRRRGRSATEISMFESLKVFYEVKFVPIRRLVCGYVTVISMLIFFTISSPLVEYVNVSKSSRHVIGAITILLYLSFLIIAIPIKWLGGVNEQNEQYVLRDVRETEKQEVEGEIQDISNLNEPNALPETTESAYSPTQANICTLTPSPNTILFSVHSSIANTNVFQGTQDPTYNGTIKDILLAPDIWLIMVVFLFQSALGFIIVYNASTVYVALTGQNRSPGLSALYTALLGVGSATGRLLMGLFEAFIQSQPSDNRRYVITMVLPIFPAIAVVAGILILVLPGKMLLLPYILVYLEEGMSNGIRALIYPSLFEHNISIYYNMSFMTAVIGVVCFNRLLFGEYIDHQRKKLGYADSGDCKSRECVRVPFIVVICLACLSVLAAIVVHVRYSRFVERQRKMMADQANAETDENDEIERNGN